MKNDYKINGGVEGGSRLFLQEDSEICATSTGGK